MKDVAEKSSRDVPSLPHAEYVFFKQALKAMAQPGEPFQYLGRIGVPLLHLCCNALSQHEYRFCCRQWLTESQMNGDKHSGSELCA